MPAASPLDPYIPAWTTRERYQLIVPAPSERVYQAAMQMDWNSVPLIRAIFRMRNLLMRAGPEAGPTRVEPFPEQVKHLGWGIVAEQPGRFFIVGGYCQPWLGQVVFHPLTRDTFGEFSEPGYVKIAFTIEVEPLGATLSRLITETSTLATDAQSERRFRRYWRWARFGIYTIRWLLLPAIRRRAVGQRGSEARGSGEE